MIETLMKELSAQADLTKRLQDIRNDNITKIARLEKKLDKVKTDLNEMINYEPDNMVCSDYEELKDMAEVILKEII